MTDINIQLENLQKLKLQLLDKYLEADRKWKEYIDSIGVKVLSNERILTHKRLTDELSKNKYIYETFTRNTFAVENILHALKDLYDIDENLINQKGQERAISSALACHMRMYFENTYNIDCEYNRHIDGEKLITSSAKASERPDIIVHRRQTDEMNLLAIEIKQNEITNNDIEKLVNLTELNGDFHYKIGLAITIKINGYDILLFIDGMSLELVCTL